MDTSISILFLTALTIGVTHVILGPDHYLPFIVSSKAGKWSLPKTMFITMITGIGHVIGSVVLGLLGVLLSLNLQRLEIIESIRGDWAGWLLTFFGFVYLIWALFKMNHGHTHKIDGQKFNSTPWILFIIFALGPCEPLIPLLIYPAAKGNFISVIMVALIFSVSTIFTMMIAVYLGYYGLSLVKLQKLDKYAHVLAGTAIFLSGIAVTFLGL